MKILYWLFLLFSFFTIGACDRTNNQIGAATTPPSDAPANGKVRSGISPIGPVYYTPRQLRGFRAVAKLRCEKGHDIGCYNLAEMMATGSGGEVDLEGSRKIFRELCDKGFKLACKIDSK